MVGVRKYFNVYILLLLFKIKEAKKMIKVEKAIEAVKVTYIDYIDNEDINEIGNGIISLLKRGRRDRKVLKRVEVELEKYKGMWDEVYAWYGEKSCTDYDWAVSSKMDCVKQKFFPKEGVKVIE